MSIVRPLAVVAAIVAAAALALMAFEDNFIYFPSRHPSGDWDPARSGLRRHEPRWTS